MCLGNWLCTQDITDTQVKVGIRFINGDFHLIIVIQGRDFTKP